MKTIFSWNILDPYLTNNSSINLSSYNDNRIKRIVNYIINILEKPFYSISNLSNLSIQLRTITHKPDILAFIEVPEYYENKYTGGLVEYLLDSGKFNNYNISCLFKAHSGLDDKPDKAHCYELYRDNENKGNKDRYISTECNQYLLDVKPINLYRHGIVVLHNKILDIKFSTSISFTVDALWSNAIALILANDIDIYITVHLNSAVGEGPKAKGWLRELQVKSIKELIDKTSYLQNKNVFLFGDLNDIDFNHSLSNIIGEMYTSTSIPLSTKVGNPILDERTCSKIKCIDEWNDTYIIDRMIHNKNIEINCYSPLFININNEDINTNKLKNKYQEQVLSDHLPIVYNLL